MATRFINAVSSTKCYQFVEHSSDKRVIEIFCGMNSNARKHILLTYFQQFNPIYYQQQKKHQISRSANDIAVFSFMDNILHHKANSGSNNLGNLSNELIANIVSFMNMKDRLLSCEQVCNKFYNACQIGIAKTELCITKAFVKNTFDHNLNLSKFINISHLSINFVLCNPLRFNANNKNKMDLELKYYKILNDIIANSPRLKTLEYNLKENSFRSHLGDSNKWNKQYYGNLGHVVSNLPSLAKLNNLNKLIWVEKEFKDICWIQGGGKSIERVHQWLLPQDDITKFIDIFRNIKVLAIPSHFNLESYPLVSQIWNNKKYHKTITDLHINLKDIIIEKDDDNDDDNIVVAAIGHPLNVLNQYENLAKLQLDLPIFTNCIDYYQSLLSMKCWTKHKKRKLRQSKLKDIELNFCIDSYVEKSSTLNIIEKILIYVLKHCTKIINFKCSINNQSSHQFKIKHCSYLNKLNVKSIETLSYQSDDIDIKQFVSELNKIKLTHLKRLTLTIYHKDEDISYYLKDIDLNKLKALRSLRVYISSSFTIKNVIDILKLIKEKDLRKTKIKHIQILHKNKNKLTNMKLCSTESEKICKILTQITTTYPKIKCIELQPIILCEQHLKFLYFWFMKKMDVNQLHKVRKTFFLHLKLYNNMS